MTRRVDIPAEKSASPLDLEAARGQNPAAPRQSDQALDSGARIFEVPIGTTAGNPVAPVALKHMGRFAHEAVAVDPATGIVYETEDQGDVSGFYRFVPATKPAQAGDYAEPGGVLEIPIGPEKFKRAATVAIWGPWGAGPL